MAEMKTKPTDQNVLDALNALADENRRKECFTLLELMRQVTGAEPKMWGGSTVGFGRYRYRYPTGREGEWFLTGFSPRKQNLSLHVLPGLEPFAAILQRLGKHTTGKSCLYIKRLADVDLSVLRELLTHSVASLAEMRIEDPS